jgi:hypothetical protein
VYGNARHDSTPDSDFDRRMNNKNKIGMKLILIIALIVWGTASWLMPSPARAQAWDDDYALKIVLPSDGSDPSNTLTLKAAPLSGNSTLIFPSANASGVLTNDGSGTLSWGSASVANGGTGAASLTAHGIVIGNGTSAVNVTGAGNAGQVLTSNGSSSDPTYQSQVVSIISGYLTVETGASNSTFYYNPAGGSNGTNTTQGFGTGNIFTSFFRVPRNGTIRNFYVDQSTASGMGSKSNHWYIRDETTSTDGPNFTITGNSATSGSDVSNTLSVSAGDQIEVKRVSNGGPATTGAVWSFEIDYP